MKLTERTPYHTMVSFKTTKNKRIKFKDENKTLPHLTKGTLDGWILVYAEIFM